MKFYYFTQFFPYGLKQQWKVSELNSLKTYFNEVEIIPHEFHIKDEFFINHYKEMEVAPPLFNQQVYLSLAKMGHLFSSRFFIYLKEFVFKKVYLSKKKRISFFMATYKVEKMFQSETIKRIIQQKDKDQMVLYFYWGTGSSIIAPFLKGFKNITVRFHGYDLYEERRSGYIPFQKLLLEKVSNAIFISEHGENYMINKYPKISPKCKVFRLGTTAIGNAIPSNDCIFRIFSCSSIQSLKRVDLLARTIKLLEFPVIWTHLGDGPMMREVKKEIQLLPPNITVNLLGNIPSTEVLKIYKNNKVDVFVNVSTTEGVPVSIMEAFSASIPVIATDVGGTGEIVDNSVGFLIPSILNEELLAGFLRKFYCYSEEKKMELRKNAKGRYEARCNETVLNEKFVKFLYGH